MVLTPGKMETVELRVVSYSGFPLPFISLLHCLIITHSLIRQIWSPKYCAGPAEGSRKV